jgi:hypothetical protein
MVTVENNDELYISESYKKVGERGRVEKWPKKYMHMYINE